jgi:TPR repeat protein
MGQPVPHLEEGSDYGSQRLLVRELLDPNKPHRFYCLPDHSSDTAEELKQESHNQNAAFDVPCSDMMKLQRQALEGNGDAAMKLADLFLFRSYDLDQAMYWLIISAEDGNRLAKENLSHYLNLSDKPEFRMRAKFWEDQAAKK